MNNIGNNNIIDDTPNNNVDPFANKLNQIVAQIGNKRAVEILEKFEKGEINKDDIINGDLTTLLGPTDPINKAGKMSGKPRDRNIRKYEPPVVEVTQYKKKKKKKKRQGEYVGLDGKDKDDDPKPKDPELTDPIIVGEEEIQLEETEIS